jgi:starch-binding outer membrane protein, SusD/RagB family
MKKANFKILIPSCLMALGVIYACNKSFLDIQPQGAFNPSVLATRAGVDGILIGAYHMLSGEGGNIAGNNWGSAASNWVWGGVCADDAYKGSTPSDQGDIVPLETWAYNANNPYLNSKWQAVYDGVQRANDVLRVLPLAKDISAGDLKVLAAEAKFLRAYFHFEAMKIWKYVPYVNETATTSSNVDASGNFVDPFNNVEADFLAAITDLPATQPQAGRINKSGAQAFLAKLYMYYNKYDKAKAILDGLTTGSGKTSNGQTYGLQTSYAGNFNSALDNSKESVFAYQASVNDGSGTNGNYGDNLNFPNGSGPGGCCGFYNPSMSLANAYKTDVNGLPLLDTYNTGKNVSDPTNLYVGTLDPRIDLVMGRPGIPFYDWGVVPTNAWIRDPGTDGYFSPKKTVYSKSQVGSSSSTETSFWGPTQMSAINVNLIRYSELLLWEAECELEVSGGNADHARQLVNQVRDRAANKVGWVYSGSGYDAGSSTYTTQTTPADNYKIGDYPAGSFSDPVYAHKAVLMEEYLELAMEGQRFFALRRFDKGTGFMAAWLNAYAAAEKTRPTIYNVNPTATFTKGKNEYFPIPQQQIDVKNATGKIYLKQLTGY